MAKKFDEVISEFKRIYGGETPFIRMLIEKNVELDLAGASDAEVQAALKELMTLQFRRTNKGSLQASKAPQATPSSSSSSSSSSQGSQITEASREIQVSDTPRPETNRTVTDILKDYFDNQPKRIVYKYSTDSEERTTFLCNYILENLVKLTVKITADEKSDEPSCSIHVIIPVRVLPETYYPLCSKILEINAEATARDFGNFGISGTDGADSNIYYRYRFSIENGLEISDFERYFNSACRSILQHYDDILLVSKGRLSAAEADRMAKRYPEI